MGRYHAVADEDSAAMLVSVALPAERQRIRDLLKLIPEGEESKTKELLRALNDLWAVHPREKIVVFTTYLGSVDSLQTAIDNSFPKAGVDVLKGGDHGAKLAAERRFKRPDGPSVLICTAAGREGINLQFARVLFNHDLPWNPMDLEQRIGRIHRYGQVHTAQVYNLVSADTIEGQIFPSSGREAVGNCEDARQGRRIWSGRRRSTRADSWPAFGAIVLRQVVPGRGSRSAIGSDPPGTGSCDR